MDVDERLAGMVGGRERIAVGGGLAEPRPDDEQQVRVPDPPGQGGVGAVAEVARIGRAIVGDRVLAAECGDQRHLRPPAPCCDGRCCRLVPIGAADDRDRTLRGGQQPADPFDRAVIAALSQRLHAGAIDRLDDVEQHVLGQREHHRAGAAVHRGRIGAGDIFGDAAGIVDPGGPFGDGREHRGEVDLLERLAVLGRAVDVADEQYHRPAVLHGDVDADAGVGRPRAASDEGDAGPMGEGAVRAGHEGRPAFLTAGDEVDRGCVVERIEDAQEAFAGHGEDPVATLDGEVVDEDAATGSACHGRRVGRLRAVRKGVDGPRR